MRLRREDPLACALVDAIHAGELESLRRLLDGHPGLAAAQVEMPRGGSSTPLKFATDWPGYFPNGPAVVRKLIAAGAEVDARGEGGFSETPLQWAASSDDADVARALIDAGADIEAGGASIANGRVLDNAIGYACWAVARLLVERGARVDKLWHAAALGMTARVEKLLASTPPPSKQDLTDAFYQACAGGQRRVAELLLTRGAELNGSPSWEDKTTPLDAASGQGTGRDLLVSWLRAQGARSARGGG
jgi:uncharacterized protein